MEFVKSYRDLEVYKLTRELCFEIFDETKKFPKAETYSLIDQIRRSSRSVGAQIAELWGKQRYNKHFISKLTDSLGELYETKHWIDIALDCNYLSKEKADTWQKRCDVIERMLNSMIKKSNKFCTAQKQSSTRVVPEVS